MRGFWLGVVTTLLLGALGLLAFLGLGLMPVSADAKPGALEAWIADFARESAIERAAPDGESPVQPTAENLTTAAALYRDNCGGCHGTPDAKQNLFAASLYPPAPQFLGPGTKHFHDADGEVFVMIRDGIRLTGMPTFAHMLKEQEIWQLVTFLKHLEGLPPEAVNALASH
jgi:mono/diheme cytochrome c family protein